MRLNYRFSKEQSLDHSSHVNDDSGKPSRREWVSFWSLIGMQSTNAFNDSFTKFILIPLGMGLAQVVWRGLDWMCAEWSGAGWGGVGWWVRGGVGWWSSRGRPQEFFFSFLVF